MYKIIKSTRKSRVDQCLNPFDKGTFQEMIDTLGYIRTLMNHLKFKTKYIHPHKLRVTVAPKQFVEFKLIKESDHV